MTTATETGCCGGVQRSTRHEAASSALQILAERFARGEINKVEFEEKRQVIAGMPDETAPSTKGRKNDCCC